jgi:hypothetical protein
MSRIKMALMAMVAVFAIGAVGAGAASADGVVSGNIQGEALGNSVDCDYTMDYVGTNTPSDDPADDVTLVASSFAGAGANGCDEDSLEINDDINVTFTNTGGSSYTAVLDRIDVTDNGSGCTFVATGTQAFSTTGALGIYAGSDTAPGQGFPCNLVTADLDITASFTP